MFSSGAAAIEKALGQFTKIRTQLEKGVDEVDAQIDANYAAVEALTRSTSALGASRQLAKNAIAGIDKLLSGG